MDIPNDTANRVTVKIILRDNCVIRMNMDSEATANKWLMGLATTKGPTIWIEGSYGITVFRLDQLVMASIDQ